MDDPSSGDRDRAGRFRAQLLTGPPATSVLGVVERLLAVQAQDPRGFRLAVRARSRGLSAADVEHALTVDRSVVVTWANRGTLHLVRTEDHSWLHALTTPQLRVTNARRLAQEGVSPDDAVRGVRAIERALTADGPLTRAQLRERVAAAGLRVEGQAFVHVLFRGEIEGVSVRGPVVDGEHAHVLVRDWLGAPPPALDRTVALTRLAERYLAGHGPAGDRDLARWAGIGLGEVRRGLAGLGSRLRDVGGGLVDLAGREPAPPAPPAPLLLGAFDPLLLGWSAREWLLDGSAGIVTSNGIFRPFALVDGRAAGTWAMPGGQVALAPFEPLPAAVAQTLAVEAADVVRFLTGAAAGGPAGLPRSDLRTGR